MIGLGQQAEFSGRDRRGKHRLAQIGRTRNRYQSAVWLPRTLHAQDRIGLALDENSDPLGKRRFRGLFAYFGLPGVEQGFILNAHAYARR